MCALRSRPDPLRGVGLRGLGSLHLRLGVVHASLTLGMGQNTAGSGLFLLYNPQAEQVWLPGLEGPGEG